MEVMEGMDVMVVMVDMVHTFVDMEGTDGDIIDSLDITVACL